MVAKNSWDKYGIMEDVSELDAARTEATELDVSCMITCIFADVKYVRDVESKI